MTTSDELMSALVHGDDGAMSVDLAVAPAVFYHDCDAELTATAVSHLRRMRLGVVQEAAIRRRAAWKQIESTYVVCTDDRTIAPRVAAEDGDATPTHVVEWDTSHSPMLSQPDLVAELLADLAGGTS